jgi:hypothetical protein
MRTILVATVSYLMVSAAFAQLPENQWGDPSPASKTPGQRPDLSKAPPPPSKTPAQRPDRPKAPPPASKTPAQRPSTESDEAPPITDTKEVQSQTRPATGIQKRGWSFGCEDISGPFELNGLFRYTARCYVAIPFEPAPLQFAPPPDDQTPTTSPSGAQPDSSSQGSDRD